VNYKHMMKVTCPIRNTDLSLFSHPTNSTLFITNSMTDSLTNQLLGAESFLKS